MKIIISVDIEKRELFSISNISGIGRDVSGIYFLLDEYRILYIGQSKDIKKRLISWHRKKYDSSNMQKVKYFFYEYVDKHCLADVELANIAKYMPTFNIAGKFEPKYMQFI